MEAEPVKSQEEPRNKKPRQGRKTETGRRRGDTDKGAKVATGKLEEIEIESDGKKRPSDKDPNGEMGRFQDGGDQTWAW